MVLVCNFLGGHKRAETTCDCLVFIVGVNVAVQVLGVCGTKGALRAREWLLFGMGSYVLLETGGIERVILAVGTVMRPSSSAALLAPSATTTHFHLWGMAALMVGACLAIHYLHTLNTATKIMFGHQRLLGCPCCARKQTTLG